MNQIEIQIGKTAKKVMAPTSWNDLPVRQLLLFYETLFNNTGDEFTANSFSSVKLITMTQMVMGVDFAFMAKWEGERMKEDPEHGYLAFLADLKEIIKAALAGLFEINEEDGTSYAIKFNLTKNPYPDMVYTAPKKGKKLPKSTWMYAPADELANITIYELAYTFQLYEAYLATGDEHLAMQLIGCLYRPSRPETRADRESGWFGDRRQPLRKYEAKIDERAQQADGLPTLTKRIILFWFGSCRDHIIKQWPQVFKKSDGDGGGSSNHWGDLLLSVAETAVFGPLDNTADQHYSNVLQLLTKRDNEARAMERTLAKTKRK